MRTDAAARIIPAAREAGFSDFLVKPFEAGGLEAVLSRLLPKGGGMIH